MKIWLVQLEAKVGDKKANLNKMLKYVDRAVRKDVNMVVFGELVLSGYNCGRRFFELGEPVPGPSTDRIAARLKGTNTYVVFGMPEAKEGALYNSAPLIGPEGLVGVCRKLFLANFYSPATEVTLDEAVYFKPGEDIAVFDTSFGKMGVQVCLDVYYPELARAQALAGAWLIVQPSASPVRKVGEQMSPYAPVRALENIVHWCYVNQVGTQEGVSFGGSTLAIDAAKGVVARASSGKNAVEEVVECELDREVIWQRRRILPNLRDCRPDVFEKLYKISRKAKFGD